MHYQMIVMNIPVTGVAGFIGSHVAERLSALGHKVTGWDNFSDYYDVSLKEQTAATLVEQGIIVQRVDLFTDDLDKAYAEDFDYLFHFAAQPGISASSTFASYLNNNVIATQRLLTVLESRQKRPFFVNIATSSIYGLEATMNEQQAPLPASWYGVTKLAAEQLVLAYCRRGFLTGVSLRLYSVYGPRERPDKLYTRLIDCGLNQKPFPLYQGSEVHRRSFTFVGDIVDGIVSVIGKEAVCNAEVFNLGTAIEHSTAEGMEIVAKLLGRSIEKEIKPPRPGDQSRTQANIKKAESILNYHPKTSLEQGLMAQIDWFKNK